MKSQGVRYGASSDTEYNLPQLTGKIGQSSLATDKSSGHAGNGSGGGAGAKAGTQGGSRAEKRRRHCYDGIEAIRRWIVSSGSCQWAMVVLPVDGGRGWVRIALRRERELAMVGGDAAEGMQLRREGAMRSN